MDPPPRALNLTLSLFSDPLYMARFRARLLLHIPVLDLMSIQILLLEINTVPSYMYMPHRPSRSNSDTSSSRPPLLCPPGRQLASKPQRAERLKGLISLLASQLHC